MALHAVACWIWLALALAVAPAAAAPPATQSAAEIAATVVSATGDTTLVRSTTVRTPLRTGEPIRAGDRIVTGEDSTVQLRFTDGGLVSVMARTDFAVEEYRLEPERERSFLRLARGMVRAVSGSIGKRNHDDYRLKTPTATIGIRGTEFIANERVCRIDCPADFAPGLAVTVLQGRVAVTSQAGTIEVPQGETAVVGSRSAMPMIQRPDAPPSAPALPPSRTPREPA
ncbi:MAG TPA: FecR domain-containing protein, partial [Burkholderiaceae bacterium]|nr:FecR domain-containing protein [Burkholderiaceae bacterium]